MMMILHPFLLHLPWNFTTSMHPRVMAREASLNESKSFTGMEFPVISGGQASKAS